MQGQNHWHPMPNSQLPPWSIPPELFRHYQSTLPTSFMLPLSTHQSHNWTSNLLQYPLFSPVYHGNPTFAIDLRNKYFHPPIASPSRIDHSHDAKQIKLSPSSSEDLTILRHPPKKRRRNRHLTASSNSSPADLGLPLSAAASERPPPAKPSSISPGSAASVDLTSPVNGIRITSEAEFSAGGSVADCLEQRCRVVRGDIGADQVEVTPEARAEIAQIDNRLGDYVCRLCLVVYEDAFELARHRCPRIVHVEYCCPECQKSFNCPANLASHQRWHRPSKALNPFSMEAILGWKPGFKGHKSKKRSTVTHK